MSPHGATVSIELRRSTRIRRLGGSTVQRTLRTPRRLVLLLALAGLLSVPTVALANHVFSDVGDGSVHAPGIEYLADTGITAGCDEGPPPRFCPGDSLTRAQMGTFLYRSSGHDPATPPSVNAASIADIEIVHDENTVGGNSSTNPNSVTCPDGMIAFGGGGTAVNGWVLKDSYPLDDGIGWRVVHRTDDGQVFGQNSTNTVYAVCVAGNVAE
jgi:hypothetical protein